MTLDRKDYKSAIPQLEGRLAEVEKIGKEAFNKFEDIAHKTQIEVAEAEKKALALDYKMTTTRVQMEYQLQTTGLDPVEANWQTTMPSITYNSYQGKTLWYRSKTYVNDIVVQKTEPMTVNLMDGVYTFVNSVSGNTGWTTIDGDTIQTGKITSANGYCYFDLDRDNFQLKNNSTLASSTSAIAWDDGQLYIKGRIAVGNTASERAYYTEMTGGGFVVVANNNTIAHIGYATESLPRWYYTFGSRKIPTANYSSSQSYVYGDVCIHDNFHYVCIRQTPSPAGSWNDTYWQLINGHLSFASGDTNVSAGRCSAVFGRGNVSHYDNQFVVGKYNQSKNALFVIGNGTSENARSNAFAVDINGNITAGSLDCGSVSITPVADQVTSKSVTFNHTFSSAPNVVATAQSAVPGTVSEVTVSDVTTTGFTMYLLRSNTTTTNIYWIAML